ncbi:MAG: hypothetical protein U0929_09050 [Planctomycetaceae bacterium]
MITYSLRRSFSLAYAGLLVTTAFISVTRADDSEGVVRVRNTGNSPVARGQSPQPQAPILPPAQRTTYAGQYQSFQPIVPRPLQTNQPIPPVSPPALYVSQPAQPYTQQPVQAAPVTSPIQQVNQPLPQYSQVFTQENHPVNNETATVPTTDYSTVGAQGCAAPDSCAAPSSCAAPNTCDATSECCPTTSSCTADGCSGGCPSDVCFDDCDPVIGRRFGRGMRGGFGGGLGGGRCANGRCGGRMHGGRWARGEVYGDEFCQDGTCGQRGCGRCAGGGTLVQRELAKTCAWARLKFGYFIPTGSCGYGTPPFGHYSMVYPVNPQHFDARDGQVYAAQGYAGPVSVPIAPVVNHTYNYGWGIPSSRLTPISHPVSLSQAESYRANQYAAPQGLK